MKTEEITVFSAELLEQVNALLPQLSRSASPLSETELRDIVDSDTSRLLAAVDGGSIYGMLTLIVFRIPTGVRAWVEDVVIDEQHRGKGVATSLLNAAVNLAKSSGAKTIDLTSRPEREAANRLYQKVGFVKRNTNVYRIAL